MLEERRWFLHRERALTRRFRLGLSAALLAFAVAAILAAGNAEAGEVQALPQRQAQLQAPSLVQPKPFATDVVKVHHEVGMASFYTGSGRTASGMKPSGMTAAHRVLPFGSHVKVKDLKTGREVVVIIVDRGPFQKSRVIDLSHQAAQQLGIVGRGIAKVEVVGQ